MTRTTRAAVVAVTVLGAAGFAPPQASPRAVVDELIAADRAFARAAQGTDLVAGIAATFADDVIVPLPPGRFARSKAEAIAALRATPQAATSRATWMPLKAGISADGLHGFTAGTMTVTHADDSAEPMKYLAYWVKGATGWRVAAFKRVPSAAGAAPTAMLEPALPARLVPPPKERGAVEAARASLIAAEQGFSDLAQRIGLGPAFLETGRADAINLGGRSTPGFVVGNAAIATLVRGDATPLDPRFRWSAGEGAIVASSGDLGVTFGFIHAATAPAGEADSAAFPFFTIWMRPGGAGAWKYVAE